MLVEAEPSNSANSADETLAFDAEAVISGLLVDASDLRSVVVVSE